MALTFKEIEMEVNVIPKEYEYNLKLSQKELDDLHGILCFVARSNTAYDILIATEHLVTDPNDYSRFDIQEDGFGGYAVVPTFGEKGENV
jgi:hypothetical protein